MIKSRFCTKAKLSISLHANKGGPLITWKHIPPKFKLYVNLFTFLQRHRNTYTINKIQILYKPFHFFAVDICHFWIWRLYANLLTFLRQYPTYESTVCHFWIWRLHVNLFTFLRQYPTYGFDPPHHKRAGRPTTFKARDSPLPPSKPSVRNSNTTFYAHIQDRICIGYCGRT